MDDLNRPRQPSSDLLDLKTASTRFSLSSRTLRRLLDRGLRCYRPSPHGKILLDPTDVLDFLLTPQKPQPDMNAMVAETLRDLQQGGGK